MKQHISKADSLSLSEEQRKSGGWIMEGTMRILAPCPIPRISAVTAGEGGSHSGTVPIFVGAMIGALGE